MALAEQSKPTAIDRVTLEAWSQGFMVGALIIMMGITLANMRRHILLHKLILIELILAVPNGFFIFFDPPVYGWFLSTTVIFLLASWTLHNVIAWMKCKPFLGKRGSYLYIGSVLLVQPYWVLEIYANFVFFNGNNHALFAATRPYEALFRDPWWIFTILNLFWNIRYRYELGLVTIIKVSPRFGILLTCMTISCVCIIVDLLSVTPVVPIGVINPFWKFAFVFKCFTDSIILDDFKAALDKLSRHRMSQILPFNIFLDEEPYSPDACSDTAKTFRWYGRGSNNQPPSQHAFSLDAESKTDLPKPVVVEIERLPEVKLSDINKN